MGSKRAKLLTRCCYGAVSILALAVMFWIAWCLFGLSVVQVSEPQRRALVHYTLSSTSSTPVTQETSASNAISKLPTTSSLEPKGKDLAKGDFRPREKHDNDTRGDSKPPRVLSSSADKSTDLKTVESEKVQDGIHTRRVSSTGIENRQDERAKPDESTSEISPTRAHLETRTESRRDEVELPKRDDIQSSRRPEPAHREPEFNRDDARRRVPAPGRYDDDYDDRGSKGKYHSAERGRETDDRYSKGDTRVYPDRELPKEDDERRRYRERYPEDRVRKGDDDDRYRYRDEIPRPVDLDRDRGDKILPKEDRPRPRNDERYRDRDDVKYMIRDDDRDRDDDRYSKDRGGSRPRDSEDDRYKYRDDERLRPRDDEEYRYRDDDKIRRRDDDKYPIRDDDRSGKRDDRYRDERYRDDRYRDDRYRDERYRDDDERRSRDRDKYPMREDGRYRDGHRDDRRDPPRRYDDDRDVYRPRTDDDKYGPDEREIPPRIRSDSPVGDRKPTSSRYEYSLRSEERVEDYSIPVRESSRSRDETTRLPRPVYDDERPRDRDDDDRRPYRYEKDRLEISPTRTREASAYDKSSIESRPRVSGDDDWRYSDRPRTRPRYDDDPDRRRGTVIQDSRSSVSSNETTRRFTDDRDSYQTKPLVDSTKDYRPSDRRDEVVLDQRSQPSEDEYVKDARRSDGRRRTGDDDVVLDRRSHASEDDYRKDSRRNDDRRRTGDDDKSYSRRDRIDDDEYYRDRIRVRDRYDDDPRKYDDRYDDRYPRDPMSRPVRRYHDDDEIPRRDPVRIESSLEEDQRTRNRDRSYIRDDYGDYKPSSSRRYDEEDWRGSERPRRPANTRAPIVGSSMTSRDPGDAVAREKRFPSPENSRVPDDYVSGNRPLSVKDVIDVANKRSDTSQSNSGKVYYPAFDPRQSNLTSSEIIQPKERRGTTITSKRRRRSF